MKKTAKSQGTPVNFKKNEKWGTPRGKRGRPQTNPVDEKK